MDKEAGVGGEIGDDGATLVLVPDRAQWSQEPRVIVREVARPRPAHRIHDGESDRRAGRDGPHAARDDHEIRGAARFQLGRAGREPDECRAGRGVWQRAQS